MQTKNYTCPICQKQITVTVYDPLNRASVARQKFELAVGEHLQHHKRLTSRAADECHTCGATASFSDDVCIECGTRR